MKLWILVGKETEGMKLFVILSFLEIGNCQARFLIRYELYRLLIQGIYTGTETLQVLSEPILFSHYYVLSHYGKLLSSSVHLKLMTSSMNQFNLP